MRTYYLFAINDYFYNNYKKAPNNLYKTLENLYNLKSNFNYGISLFNQICNIINIDVIENYIMRKYDIIKSSNDHAILLNGILIKISYPCVIIHCQENIPYILKSFLYYDNNIFVCDFNNNDYFFLSSIYNKSKVLEYN